MGVSQVTAREDSEYGVSVADALELPCLAGARLVAGAGGSARRIRVVNIMEVPDIVRWMRGGELLLTTAYPLRDDPDALEALIPTLAERGLAAVGVKVGPYLPTLPPLMIEAAEHLGFPLLELPGEVMFNDILAEVLGTVLNQQAMELERSRSIHDQLTAVALRAGSYQDLMDVLLQLSGCGAAVRDAHGWVLASAGAPPVDAPPAARFPITIGGTMQGEVALWTDRDVLSHQIMALEHATTIATMLATQERAVASREQRYRSLLLMELVSRRPPDRAEMCRRAAAMGWDLHVPRAAILVEIAEPGSVSPPAVHMGEEQLVPLVRAAAGDGAIVWGSQAGLCMLVDASSSSLETIGRRVHDAIITAHPGWAVMVAAGTPSDDFGDYHRSYQEAVETLTLGREVHGTDFVLRYDELGIYRLLNQIPTTELQQLVNEALGSLQQYDREQNGRLVHSLGVYLQQQRNGVEAAAKLHIHYNTLRYRLEQIERLTGGIERHPTSRLQIELAVHALRLLEAQSGA